jgi:hypothetical protein
MGTASSNLLKQLTILVRSGRRERKLSSPADAPALRCQRPQRTRPPHLRPHHARQAATEPPAESSPTPPTSARPTTAALTTGSRSRNKSRARSAVLGGYCGNGILRLSVQTWMICVADSHVCRPLVMGRLAGKTYALQQRTFVRSLTMTTWRGVGLAVSVFEVAIGPDSVAGKFRVEVLGSPDGGVAAGGHRA